jgi:type II secretory pathway pseudopilin PulG
MMHKKSGWKKLTSQKGFSIVEMIVYIAILAFVTLGIINTLLLAGKSWVALESNRILNVSAQSTFEVITREIRNALSIDVAQSTFTSTSSVLMLNTQDLTGNAVAVKFFVQNGAIKIQRGTASAYPLTLSAASSTSFTMYRITTPQSEGVKIDMTIQSGIRNVYREQNFSTTVMLRGGYSN